MDKFARRIVAKRDPDVEATTYALEKSLLARLAIPTLERLH
jgi:hypothetical protein